MNNYIDCFKGLNRVLGLINKNEIIKTNWNY